MFCVTVMEGSNDPLVLLSPYKKLVFTMAPEDSREQRRVFRGPSAGI